MPDLPILFDTEEETLARGTEFRQYVENIVQGSRAPQTHPSTPVPRQLEKITIRQVCHA